MKHSKIGRLLYSRVERIIDLIAPVTTIKILAIVLNIAISSIVLVIAMIQAYTRTLLYFDFTGLNHSKNAGITIMVGLTIQFLINFSLLRFEKRPSFSVNEIFRIILWAAIAQLAYVFIIGVFGIQFFCSIGKCGW